MNNKNDGGPAFPRSETGSAETGQIDPGAEGMSLRDWFAGMAMQGAIAHHNDCSEEKCYDIADAMLAERRRRYHEESEPPQTKEMDNDRPENDDY